MTQSYVGRSVPRIEDARLLTGKSRFIADVSCEGELHCSFVRSNVAHGMLRHVDTGRADRQPGVVGVFTARDVPSVTVPVRLLPTPAGRLAQQPVLAHDRVRYVGEPIAIVVAADAYAAEDAAQAVDVIIEPLEPVLDLTEAAEPTAVVLFPELGSNVIERATMRHGEDVDALFSNAFVRISDTLSIHRHGSVPLEPRGLLAVNDQTTGRLTVWGPAKVKHHNLAMLAGLLNMAPDRIRFIECDVGGAFGARGEFYPEDFLIPWLSLELGRPVKWVEDRRESLMSMNQSREQRWQFEIGASADGTLMVFRAKAWFNQGAYVRTHGSVLLPKVMLNHIVGPYRWQGFEAEAMTVLSTKTPAGTYRGPCQYEATFVRERMLDRLAGELAIDPAEMRSRNLISRDALPFTIGVPDYVTDEPVMIEDGDYRRVFDELLTHARYAELRADVEARRRKGDRLGIGLSAFIEVGAPGPFEWARVVPQSDGSFTIHVGIASVGQGVETALSQIAADALGIGLDRVTISYRDTDLVPAGLGAFSSRTTMFGGNAIAGAAAELCRQALRAGAERTGVPEERLEFRDGLIVLPGGGTLPVAPLGVEGEYEYRPVPGSHVAMGANLALVRICPVTGAPLVLRYVVAYDVGRVVNPQALEGQVVGAVIQGVGGALYEEFRYDEQGQPLSTTFIDYLLPTAVEAPEVAVKLLEFGETSDRNPLAIKGGGEGGIVGVGAATANAVADAIGQRGAEITSLPLRPESILKLCSPSRTTDTSTFLDEFCLEMVPDGLYNLTAHLDR